MSASDLTPEFLRAEANILRSRRRPIDALLAHRLDSLADAWRDQVVSLLAENEAAMKILRSAPIPDENGDCENCSPQERSHERG